MNIYAQRDTIVQRETLQKNSSIHSYNLAKTIHPQFSETM